LPTTLDDVAAVIGSTQWPIGPACEPTGNRAPDMALDSVKIRPERFTVFVNGIGFLFFDEHGSFSIGVSGGLILTLPIGRILCY
jgi:hypothetical protein